MTRTLFFVCLFAISVSGQEKVNLTTAITRPSITAYEPIRLVLDWSQPSVEVTLRATAEDCTSPRVDRTMCFKLVNYSGENAATLITQLNTANLSTVSLRKRILQKLVSDGHLVGTVQ